MRGLRSTLILAVIVAGLAYALTQLGGEEAGTSLMEPALDERSVLQAEVITVRNQIDVAPIELRRASGYDFEVSEPVRDLASAAKLREIAGVWDTAQLAPAHAPEDVTDDLLVETGLDKPRGELKVRYPDREIHIEIGEDGALGRDVFVRKNGGIYWASKALFTSLDGTADDYREGRVFRGTSSDVRTLTVSRRRPGGEVERLVLRQLQPGRYRMLEPVAARAHLAGAEQFVQSVLGMRVGIFVRGNMLPQPEPDWEIEIEGRAGVQKLRLWRQPNTMLLGLQEPRQLAFKMEDREYSRMFDVPARMLRSELLVPLAVDEIAHVVLDPGPGGRAAVLRRGQQGMELEEPIRSKTHATAVLKMFEAIAALKAAEFVEGEQDDLSAFGLDEGYFTVQVKGALEPRPIVVHLGREEGEFCYARRADEPTVVKVDAAAVRDLRRPWVDYVARLGIYVYPAVNVASLRFSRGESKRSYVLDDGTWTLEGGTLEEGGVHPDDVASAVELLTHLDARKVLDPEVVGELAPPVEIVIGGLQGAVFQRMEMVRHEGATLIRLPDRGVLYELRDADGAALWALAPE